MAEIPADFGGFAGFWTAGRAVLVRYGEGKPQEAIRMTPVNLLQVRQIIDTLITQGREEGQITDEHRQQSDAMPVTPLADVMPRDEVDQIAGTE